jgi:hypothetical protein
MPLLESLLLSNGAKNLNIIGIDFVHTAWGGPDQPSGYLLQLTDQFVLESCVHLFCFEC